MSHPAIELSGVSVRYGEKRALDDIDLTIDAGEFVVLIGPSGQGKSTLLNVIAGLVRPSTGQVLASGERVRGPGRERSMVFQEDTVLPWMRVEDNVAWGLELRGMPAGERRTVAGHYLREVGLAEEARSWPRQLSGGMRKRVAVATAFAADPKVLLMDEPFGSLDFVTRATLHAILIRLWSEEHKTVVFVTHDVDEALLLADRVVVLRHGRIAEDLRPDLPRPRTDDQRSDPTAIALRRHLLDQLGVIDPGRAAAA